MRLHAASEENEYLYRKVCAGACPSCSLQLCIHRFYHLIAVTIVVVYLLIP